MLKVNFENTTSDSNEPIYIAIEKEQILVNGDTFNGDIIKISENHFHVLWKHKSYEVHILEENKKTKTCKLSVNGIEINTSIQDKFDLLLENMGIKNNTALHVKDTKAPMPGLIQEVFVSDGQAVKQGDSLLVLVAMKMENIIKASSDAIIKSIKVKDGQIVEKNQVLMDFQ